MRDKKPLFITFEGGEGAGKTTLIEKIEHELQERGYDVIKTREPGGSLLGNQIRHWILNRDSSVSISAKAELLLFLAGRAQHLEELIKPALRAGKIILCDRFNDSTIAYQGIARGLGMEFVQDLCEKVCNGTQPNLTFFLDVDPKIGLKRTLKAHKENANIGQFDRIEAEKLEFHQKVRDGLQKLAFQHPERVRILDANQIAEKVFDEALKHLDQLIS
jgi:dTMP kinase